MLVCTAYCNHDAELAANLFEWCAELSGKLNHHCLLVASQGMDEEVSQAVVRAAKFAFERVDLIRPKTANEQGWPVSPNHLFKTAAAYVSKIAKRPFFWLEPDCTPLVPDWMDRLESEYVKCGKPYMGFKRDIPIPHLTGVAIYPANIAEYNPDCLTPQRNSRGPLPFDVVAPLKTLKHAHITKLIHHDWGVKDQPPTFPNRDSVDVIHPDAVLFHRVKDGSLIQRLREQKNPTTAMKMGSLMDRMTHKLKEPFRRKLKLPNVTLWGCVGSDDADYLKRTIRVLKYCNRLIEPEKTVLFAHLPVPKDFEYDYVQVPKMDVAQFNIFHNRVSPLKLMESEFAFSVHEDGGPLDISLWDEEYLLCDYIGAPWKDGLVGNGGFAIESRAFMEAKMKLPPYDPKKIIASDYYVARTHRMQLEEAGIRFAPTELALKFATETCGNDQPSFGFHGRNYAVRKYRQFWKLVEASENV